MASQAHNDKEKFFADLYALDGLASDGEDDDIFRATKHDSRRLMDDARQGSRSSHEPNAQNAGNSGSNSVEGEDATKKLGRGNRTSRERTPPHPRLINSKTTPGATSDKVFEYTPRLRRIQTEDPAPKASKKAKKGGPEVPQIFAGQTFFFVPNDNRTIPRRRRIDKAILHGATWARVWALDVTHVIVESDRNLRDWVKITGQEQLPPKLAFVRETWLTESLSFKEMRDSTAGRFQIVGKPDEKSVPTKEFQLDSSEEHTKDSSRCSPVAGYQERPQDALDDLYEQVRATQHLPLDSDGDTTPTSSFDSDTSFDEVEVKSNKDFQCMLKNDGKTANTNPNAVTIGILQQMASFYDRVGDTWRFLSYRKAITSLRKQKTKIETEEQARAVPNIGKRLAAKIEEIVLTNRLRRLESAEADPHEQAMRLFSGIYSVGISLASKWIAQGHCSLEDIRTKVELTPNQRIGLEHHEDFGMRIPRAEVAEHATVVEDTLRKFDPKLQLIIGGSYRRGAPDSGDIDCLITKEDATIEHIHKIMVESVVPFLFRIGFLKAALATGQSACNGSKWHGVSALPSSKVWRRIDLLCVPWNELGAALIYFTGDDIFNRSIRLLASMHGMRLNQHGLHKDVMRGRKRERITEGKLVEGQSEEKIFSILQVPWRGPEERICRGVD